MTRIATTAFVLTTALIVVSCKDSTAPQLHSAPASLDAVTSMTVSGVVGSAMTPPPMVRVSNDSGRPLSGIEVHFGTESGDSTEFATTVTDDEGQASAGRWTLGPAAGVHVLTVTVTGVPPLRFSATAAAGIATSLELVSGNGQTDTTNAVLGVPVVLRARDRFGNLAPGALVEFTVAADGGAIAPALATSDETGLVQGTWTLGATAGAADARVQLKGLDSTALVVHAVAKWPNLRASQIGVGYNHNCAVMADHRLVCWGDNDYGQIGDGTKEDRSVAVTIGAGTSFTQVAAGGVHTCALTASGEAQCWGANRWGQLGDGTSVDHYTPAPIAGSLRFVQLVAGAEHVCGRDSGGAVYCWGFMNNSSVGASAPVNVSGGTSFRTIATGSFKTCGIDVAGVTECFGGLDWHPSPVTNAPHFVALAGGEEHMCGLTDVGAAYCWGGNHFGELGTGSTDSSATPVPVTGGHVFRSIHSGYDWTCGITLDGRTYCWGSSSFGLFGTESSPPYTSNVPVLVPLPAGVEFSTLAGGFYHMCGIATSSAVYCWGGGFDGQLGDGLTAESDAFHHRPTADVVLRR